MESGATSGSFIPKSKKPEKTRRSWTAREEDVLINSLKDVITKGWKSENGFKPGYLTFLENAMHTSIPGINLRGNPHINSKIHVWKKNYNTLVSILSKSDIGWNGTDNTIEATDETWDTLIKDDQILRSMRHKQWTHYNDWCEIFGNDRATDLVADAISETQTPSSKTFPAFSSKTKKRKKLTEIDDSLVQAINNLATITKDTVAELVKQLVADEKISDAQDVVLEGLQRITELSDDEQVRAAQFLFHNHDDLALFKRIGEKGRICLVKRLLGGE